MVRVAVAALAIVALLGPAAAPGSAAGELSMEARVLLQGHARVGSWMAIEIHLRNDGPALDGEVRFAGGSQGRTRFGVAVDLPTQSSKTYLLHAQPPSFGRSLKLELVANGSTAATAEVAFLAHDALQLVVGVLAEKPGDIIGQLDLPTASQNGLPPVVVALGVADLPERVEGWSAIDRLIWQDVDSNQLTGPQLAAMRGWLAGGGRLIVAGGTTGIGTLNGLPDDILPYRPSSTVDVPPAALVSLLGSPPKDATDVPAYAGELVRGRALATVGDRVVAAEATYGSGSVTVLGFDPATPWIAALKETGALWRRLVPARTAGPVVLGDDSQLVQAVQQLPALALPPTGGLIALLAGYILLVGPVNYLILRRLDRREWAWVTMPALIAVFAVAAYGYGAAIRGLDVIVNEISIVRGAPDATEGSAQVYLGVFSPTRGTYRVEVPGGALLTSPLAGDWFGGEGATLDVLQGDPAVVRDLAVGYGSLRTIRAESPTVVPRLSATLKLKDGVLVGTVANRSEAVLERVAVVLGSSVALIGDLEAGAQKDVKLTPTSNPFGGGLAERILGQAFYDGSGGFSETTARLLVRTAILNQLTYDPMFGYSGRLDAETPVILAWGTADTLDVRIEGQVPRRVANTLYYVPVAMDVSGRTTFEGDLLRSAIVENDAQFFSKDPTWINMGAGSVTIAYRPIAFNGQLQVEDLRFSFTSGEGAPRGEGKPIEPLTEIPVSCTDVTNSEPEGCTPRPQDGLPEVELFDRTGDGAWVRLPHLTIGGVYSVVEQDRYVDPSSGTVLVRFVNDQPESSIGFQFGVSIGGVVR